MDLLKSLLPPAKGVLPYYMLIVLMPPSTTRPTDN